MEQLLDQAGPPPEVGGVRLLECLEALVWIAGSREAGFHRRRLPQRGGEGGEELICRLEALDRVLGPCSGDHLVHLLWEPDLQ